MGACTEPGQLAIVTEYMDKGDMHSLLRNASFKSFLTPLKLLEMARQVSEGMTWLHQSRPPIIHRDLKPSNLLVRLFGLFVFLSFFTLFFFILLFVLLFCIYSRPSLYLFIIILSLLLSISLSFYYYSVFTFILLFILFLLLLLFFLFLLLSISLSFWKSHSYLSQNL